MIPNIGFAELILIIGLALIIFGPAKLPEIGKAMGQGLSEFKSAMRGEPEIKEENTEKIG